MKRKLMEIKKTSRGFCYGDFTDLNNDECSIQESSLATQPAIWLGINDANPQILVPNEGWKFYPIPEDVLLSTRMHLSVPLAKMLIRELQYFVEHGCLKKRTSRGTK